MRELDETKAEARAAQDADAREADEYERAVYERECAEQRAKFAALGERVTAALKAVLDANLCDATSEDWHAASRAWERETRELDTALRAIGYVRGGR